MSLPRRGWLQGAGASLAALALSGCNKIAEDAKVVRVLDGAEVLSRNVQRLIGRGALAREFTRADITPNFKANGSTDPPDADYKAMVASGFADWKLVVDGLVATPLALSLDAIRQLPRRTQITRHDCVEGWSAIGQWTGMPLGMLLKQAGLRSQARYIVFHCADLFNGTPYYESIDLIDAFHPQTILAWGMNGQTLSVGHGAPLRLRVERQLGYKQAKYVMRVEAVASLAGINGGKGGTWEDAIGYQWYAGI